MNVDFFHLLHQVLGDEGEDKEGHFMPTTDEEICCRIIELLWFFSETSPNLWWASQRCRLQVSIRNIFPQLCTQIKPQTCSKTYLHYLKNVWVMTKTQVAREMDYHDCLILMAFMSRYGKRSFNNAGELVEKIMELVELQAPVWDVSYVTDRLSHVEEGGGLTRHTKEELVQETISLVTQWRCKQCYKQDANQLLLDCGHLSLCTTCLLKTLLCPFCGVRITQSIKVYHSW